MPPDNATLRTRAERRLSLTRSDIAALPTSEVRELIHELQLHQAELEVQNEELRRAQDELQQSRRRYSDLYEFAPLGYLTLTRHGIIADANFLATRWLGAGRDELCGKCLYDFIKPRSQDNYIIHLRRIFEVEGRQSCELELAGTDMYVQLNSQACLPLDGRCVTTLTDISHFMEVSRPRVVPSATAEQNRMYG